jgi:ketosteroid isomerase-like protein
MELWELTAREQIRDTIARYNHFGDRGRYEEMVACFAPDGILIVHDEDRYEGRDALRAFFSGVAGTARPGLTQLRHCLTNLMIDVHDPDTATTSAYFQVISDIGLDHWGRYRDRLVRAEDGWLLAERSVRTDGYARGSFFADV